MLNEVDVLESAYDATLIMEEENTLISLVAPTVVTLHKKWSCMPFLHIIIFTHTCLNAVYVHILLRLVTVSDSN